MSRLKAWSPRDTGDQHHFHAHIPEFPLKLPAMVPTEKSELIQVCEDLAEAASDMVLVS